MICSHCFSHEHVSENCPLINKSREDRANLFSVRIRAGSGVIFDLYVGEVQLTKRDALNLAAWIAALADPGNKEFSKLVADIVTS